MAAYIRTKTGISFVLDGVPFHVASTDGHFPDIVNAINNDYSDDEIRDILERTKKALNNLSQLSPSLSFDGAAIYFQGELLHNYAADKIIDALNNGDQVGPVVAFLEKLLKNTSNQVITHLYSFLENGKIPLTQDGDFLVYKAIRSDWKDIHSGKFDNSIGQTVKMPRSQVDDRRDVTCSHGLHVCSYEYLPNFAHANGHVVICKVNPANVVAIPNDYNDTKMRVSEYKVIGDVDDYYKRNEDVLSSQPYFKVGQITGVRMVDDDPDTDYLPDFGPAPVDEDEDLAGEDTYGIFVRRIGQTEAEWDRDVDGFRHAFEEARGSWETDDDIAAIGVKNMATGEVMYTWGVWTK